jgi:hypothetical protein
VCLNQKGMKIEVLSENFMTVELEITTDSDHVPLLKGQKKMMAMNVKTPKLHRVFV